MRKHILSGIPGKTKIVMDLNLDGKGCQIFLRGIGFFGPYVKQAFARHGFFDFDGKKLRASLEVKIPTIDSRITGIVLGMAIREAGREKRSG